MWIEWLTVPVQWGRLVALWLCYFQGLGFSMSLTMVSSNIAGYTKKQLTGAVVFTGYCVGNIIGPQTFISSEARTFDHSPPHRDVPRCVDQLLTMHTAGYHSAYIAMLVGYAVKLAMVVLLYIYMSRVNKARDASGETNDAKAIEMGMHDQTELDNPGFRYTL